MATTIKIRDAITNQFIEIPTLVGAKGDKGEDGVQSEDVISISVKTQAEYDLISDTSTNNILYLIRV